MFGKVDKYKRLLVDMADRDTDDPDELRELLTGAISGRSHQQLKNGLFPRNESSIFKTIPCEVNWTDKQFSHGSVIIRFSCKLQFKDPCMQYDTISDVGSTSSFSSCEASPSGQMTNKPILCNTHFPRRNHNDAAAQQAVRVVRPHGGAGGQHRKGGGAALQQRLAERAGQGSGGDAGQRAWQDQGRRHAAGERGAGVVVACACDAQV